MDNAKYLIDTSIFVRFQQGQQYDKDCFPTQYNNFLKLLDEGYAISIDKVKEELNDSFFCEKYDFIFKNSINNEISDTYNSLRKDFSDYFNDYALENPDDADPFIITYAYHNKLCIVTQDEYQVSPADNLNKITIPTLCDLLGATCVDNKDKKDNAGKYDDGFGCICFTELIKKESLNK